jgi:hypothetical protein
MFGGVQKTRRRDGAQSGVNDQANWTRFDRIADARRASAVSPVGRIATNNNPKGNASHLILLPFDSAAALPKDYAVSKVPKKALVFAVSTCSNNRNAEPDRVSGHYAGTRYVSGRG